MLCLSGFELYSRWVPLLSLRTPQSLLRTVRLVPEMPKIIHSLPL